MALNNASGLRIAVGENVTFGCDMEDLELMYPVNNALIDVKLIDPDKMETAIRETIRICKDKNVLREYLETREKEVVDIMSFLFDDEYIMRAHDKTVEKQGFDKGYDKGKSEGYSKGKDEVRLEQMTKMIIKGYTEEQLLELDFTIDEIRKAKKAMQKEI